MPHSCGSSSRQKRKYTIQFGVMRLITYMPPIVTVAQVRSEKAGVLSPGPVAALM